MKYKLTKEMNKKVLMFAIFGIFLFSLSLGSSATYVNDPTSCPSAPYQSQSPTTPGELVCGYDGAIVYWYNMSTLTAPAGNTTVSSTNYGSVDGGYVLDCEAKDSVAPFCDNGGSYLCDRDSSCYNVNRQTTCVGTSSGGGFGVSECSSCRSGYNYCDGSFTDADGCEIQTGVTTFSTNSVYNSTCGAVCESGFLDINGDGSGSDGDGCEIQVGSACTVGSLSGTYDGSGVCVASKSNFTTGTEISYNSSTPLLWGNQYGSGDLVNFTNKITNESFAINNSGCIVFPDGTTQCTNVSGSSGSGNISGAGTEGQVSFFSSVSDISSSINLFWNNTLNRLGIGTNSPTNTLDVMGNATINGTLTLAPNSDAGYKLLTCGGNCLTFQHLVPSALARFRFMTNDGDGTDNNFLSIHGKGTPSDLTNQESLNLGWSQVSQIYKIITNKSGSGVYRDLSISADGSSNQLYLKNNSYVGINTNTPQNTLNVVGEANFTGDVITQSDFCIESGNCLSTSLASSDSPPWKVVLGQIQPKNFQNTVGINTTDGQATLHVAGTGLFNDTLFVYNLSSPASQNLQIQTNETTRMFFNSANGYIGINTTTPTNLLNVHGEANITSNLEVGGLISSDGNIDTDGVFSHQGQPGITDITSYWLCTDPSCTAGCQIHINGGVITACI